MAVIALASNLAENCQPSVVACPRFEPARSLADSCYWPFSNLTRLPLRYALRTQDGSPPAPTDLLVSALVDLNIHRARFQLINTRNFQRSLSATRLTESTYCIADRQNGIFWPPRLRHRSRWYIQPAAPSQQNLVVMDPPKKSIYIASSDDPRRGCGRRIGPCEAH
jgi:hypothetical protein